MVKQKKGNIINLSSQVGLTPAQDRGLLNIQSGDCDAHAAASAGTGKIQYPGQCPGSGRSKDRLQCGFLERPEVEKRTAAMVPLGRLAEPEDIADCAVFLASAAARYVTGEVLSVNGGWHPG